MLDLEHCITPDGVSEGYSFGQFETTILLAFAVPPGIDISDIVYEMSGIDNSIFVAFSDSDPIMCGVLFGPTFRDEICVSGDICRITLYKIDRSIWPVVIAGSSARGIDPKSLFMLGVYDDACGRREDAWRKFEESAALGFIHAKSVIATSLLNDGNPYLAPQDFSRGISILESIPQQSITTELQVVHFGALLSIGEAQKARAIFPGDDISNDTRLKIVRFLDSLHTFDAEIEKEMIVHLSALAEQNEPEACYLLAKRYAFGRGVTRNAEYAVRLAARAHAMDPKYPAEIDGLETGPSSSALFLTVSLAFLGFAVGIGLLRRS
jgi:hypothetical protein